MTELQDFVGTWRSERGHPYSTQTFTWVMTDDGLLGEFVVEVAAPPPGTQTWMSNPRPMRHQVQVGAPTIEEGRALFSMHGGPFVTEFRLLGGGEAVVGAAVDRLPPEFTGPEHQRSIEGHRVHMTRMSAAPQGSP
jgi:hypothetical protein